MHHDGNLGNGFRFQYYSPEGLRWGVDEALAFYKWEHHDKERVISRIMKESAERFNHKTTAAAYIQRYETMLGCKVGR